MAGQQRNVSHFFVESCHYTDLSQSIMLQITHVYCSEVLTEVLAVSLAQMWGGILENKLTLWKNTQLKGFDNHSL